MTPLIRDRKVGFMEMVHRYLDHAIRFDYTFVIVKYTLQQILGSEQDSEMGKKFLKSSTMRDLCSVFGREKELMERQAHIKANEHLNEAKEVISKDVIYIKKEVVGEDGAPYDVELALQYNDGYNENVFTFVNNINTLEGGTHLVGFRTALTRTLNQYARTEKLFKAKDSTPSGDDFREGLTAVLSIKVPDPQFESQTKIKLGNREVQGIVESLVGEGLRTFFEEKPGTPKAIFIILKIQLFLKVKNLY